MRWIALLLVAAAGAAAWWISAPYSGFQAETVLDFKRGSGMRGIADSLTKAGVIRSPYQFYIVRLLRPKASLQAGEYSFRKPASAWEVYDRIARGDIHYWEVTFPEGSNIYDIARIVGESSHIEQRDFLKEASDPSLIRDLAPAAPSLEGYLFPSTYRMNGKTTARGLVKEMTQQFRRAWHSVGGTGEVHRLVTLASLVEKETGVPAERPAVASVYVNRLERDMKLECDPTTIYAAILDGRYKGTIHKSDLANQNPYNTYQHTGLPPGPIANPGLKSLEAALRPAQTNYIFFVARGDGSGGHNFSTNASDHNRAVAEYRRGQQKGRTAEPAAAAPGARKPGGD